MLGALLTGVFAQKSLSPAGGDGLLEYMIVAASGLDTYAELDATWLAGTPVALASLSIAAAGFTLETAILTSGVKRTLIIANISNGVRSYEAFEITFSKAVVN